MGFRPSDATPTITGSDRTTSIPVYRRRRASAAGARASVAVAGPGDSCRRGRAARRSPAGGSGGHVTQAGIFGLGAPEHSYLELDLVDGASAVALVKAVAGLAGPLSTGGGVNLVAGFRPELWAEVAADGLPAGV